MRIPKGFAKNYFTLSSIQAHSTQPLVDQTYSRIYSYHLQIEKEKEVILEDDDPELLLETSSLSILIQSGKLKHCNCFYKKTTRNHIQLNPKQKLLIRPYIFANSALSPPSQILSINIF